MSNKWPEANAKLVEDKANGPAIIAMLRNKMPGLIAIEPDGSKESRVHSEAPEIESGNMLSAASALCAVGDGADRLLRRLSQRGP
jgi:phage terminase large subunit-like protein